MTAIIVKWIIVLLAILNFGFMAFDGSRALIKGDYIRPKSGEYAGQLGPWSKLVKKTGINPESTAMKSIFLLWGLTGLIITACYIFNISWAWKAMIIANIFSLWYLVPGTISSALQIILLFVFK
ncbi:MAG TPA: hypothetical protein VI461_11725 [Chitinophagaceae bacterium]|nr:hypothetical protein [Chitinophagaceae bacterium]